MRVLTTTATVVATILACANYADSFWRMECRSASGYARIDPLVDPGKTGAHVHSIFGTSGFTTTSGYNDLRAGGCTSCKVAQDKSAYWHPALYFQTSSGKFEAVNETGGMLAYYLLYPNAGETKVTAFPAGFQMIAGDTYRRNFTLPVPDPDKSSWAGDPVQSTQSALSQKAIGFNCLDYSKTPEGSLYRHFLPDKGYLDANCKDGLRLELMFPSCWNGVDITSANFKDHVAYPSLVMTGDCPKGFETRLVSLFYEIIYDTYAFVGQPGQFVIANGDPTGYGYHGDFMMGWDEGFLQNAVNTCTNPSGQIEDCPLFTIQDVSTYSQCKFNMPDDQKNDDLIGPLDTLPGDVPIQAGPARATPGGSGSGSGSGSSATSSVVIPTVPYSAGSSISTGGTYVPGGIFIASSSSSSILSSAPSSSPTLAPTPTPDPLPANEKIVGTMYSTMGNEVLELVMIEEETTVYKSTTTTLTATASAMKKLRRDHLRKHHAYGRP